jgi:hypothetical protein
MGGTVPRTLAGKKLVGKLASVAVAVGLLATVSSCGKADDAARVTTGDARVKALSAGAAATEGLDTATYKLVATDSASDGTDFTITGSVDRSRGLAESSATSSPHRSGEDGLLPGSSELIVDGDTVYLKTGGLGQMLHVSTPWVSGDAAAWRSSLFAVTFLAADPFGPFSKDDDALDGIMEFLRTISTGVTQVGSETVNGVSTTHYHADVDLPEVEAAMRQRLAETMGTAYGQDMTVDTTPGTLHVDVWIDGNDVVRRFTATGPSGDQSSSSSGDSSGDTTSETSTSGTETVTFDLLTAGQPVDISLPPADQVTKVDYGKLNDSVDTPASSYDVPGSTTTVTG